MMQRHLVANNLLVLVGSTSFALIAPTVVLIVFESVTFLLAEIAGNHEKTIRFNSLDNCSPTFCGVMLGR
jgi:hypothetical protein